MPELPDVEGFRRLVAERACGATIVDVDVRDAKVLHRVSPEELGRALVGRRLRSAERQGKWLFVPTDGETLLVHFGMTGSLRWQPCDDAITARDRVLLLTDGGRLTYRDGRNLGTIAVANDVAEREAITGPLGPDALAVRGPELGALLRGSRRGVKVTLMDQTVVAGLGNMLTDEILWRARIDPARPCRSLDDAEVDELHGALRRVLREAVRAAHIPRGPSWLSGQRGVDDPTCPRCHRRLAWRRLAGRSSLWCPHDQRAPAPHPPTAAFAGRGSG
ncbi:MAG: formamidopyrimidine-DNA glycosylase [Ilumatobacteraceae bacterium]|nr:formamidopyrimidine-DNA glycosylase [Ilumatobacteraceae bacterium]